MTRHRLVIFGKPRRWRNSRAEAEQEAVNAKLASRDEYDPTRVYLGPGVVIEGEAAWRNLT